MCKGLDLQFSAESKIDRFRFVELLPGAAVGGVSGKRFPVGVAQNEYKAGETAAVRVDGSTRLFMHGVKAGDPVKAGPDGVGVKAEPGDLARALCMVPGEDGHAGAALLLSFVPWV